MAGPITGASAAQYEELRKQYAALVAEDPEKALDHGEAAAALGITVAVLQTALGIGAK